MNKRAECVEACRVAAARKQAEHNAARADQGLWPEATRLTHEEHLDAILRVLESPDEEMCEAGADNLFGSAADDWADDAAQVFRAMLGVVGRSE